MSRFFMLARLVSLVLLVCVSVSSVAAHAHYVRSEPAADATVATAPQQVTVYYSQLLDMTQSSITVVDAAGTTVSTGQAAILASDQHAMQVALQPNLGAGRYTVRWTNLSAEDGEAESGEFSFTVGAGGAAAPTSGGSGTTAPATQLPNTGLSSTSSPVLLGLAVLALLGGVLLRRGTRQVPSGSER